MPRLSRLKSGLGALALLTSVACGGANASNQPLSPASARMVESLDQPMGEAFESERVDAALTQLIERAAESPSVAAAGRDLMSKLGESPELGEAGERFQSQLASLPAMQTLVARLMAEHPGAAPQEIGELAGAYVGKAFEAPSVDHAMDAAFDRLFERPSLKAAFEHLGDDFAASAFVERALTQSLSAADQEQIDAKLKALNGGNVPTPERAEQLMAQHAFTHERVEKLALDWIALPETERAVEEVLRELVKAEAFQHHVEHLLVRLLQKPEVQRAMITAMNALLENYEDEPRVTAAIAAVFDTPIVEEELTAFTEQVIADPALGAAVRPPLTRLVESPGFRSAFRDFALTW